MPFLIDGYNLLHASGILARGIGPGSLERSRTALLNFLVESLPPREIPRTTVVFDASAPPPGLSRVTSHRGITVRFGSEQKSADELIEELIRADSAPRALTVVSSDHRLHRAAHRRRAKAIDSDVWFADLVHRRMRQRTPGAAGPEKPSGLLSPADVDAWLREFGLEKDS